MEKMPEKFYVSGTAIASYRSKIAGLTQEKLAKLLKIPRSRLASWESRDQVVVDKAQFETLKAVLGLPDESQTKVTQEGLPIETERDKVYRELIEGKTEYLVIPRSAFQDKYRTVPIEVLEREAVREASYIQQIDRQMAMIDWLNKRLEEARADSLGSKHDVKKG